MITYEYKLIKDGKFRVGGRTSNRKYINNLIKYKSRGKRYKLKVTRETFTEENGVLRYVDCVVLFEK